MNKETVNIDDRVLSIAREMKQSILDGPPETFWKATEDKDGSEKINAQRRLLLQVIRRCVEEKFPIEEYFIYSLPLCNRNGVHFSFLHEEDYKRFEKKEILLTQVNAIDFFSTFSGRVFPQQCIYEKEKGFRQSEKKTCREAVFSYI